MEITILSIAGRFKQLFGIQALVNLMEKNPSIHNMELLPFGGYLNNMFKYDCRNTIHTYKNQKCIARYKFGEKYFYDINVSVSRYDEFPIEYVALKVDIEWALELRVDPKLDVTNYINHGVEHHDNQLLEMIWNDNYYIDDVINNYSTKKFVEPLKHVAAKLLEMGLQYFSSSKVFHRY